MRASLRTRMRGFVSLAAMTCLAMSQAGPRWPTWAEELTAQLKCGMSLEEVDRITDKAIVTLDGPAHPWFGKYLVRGGHTFSKDLHLILDAAGKLQSVFLTIRPDGWRLMATRSSPRRNLCTGELTFAFRIDWTSELQGAQVYLDGRKVAESDWVDQFLLVPVGKHDLRFEKQGFEPIIRHLDLQPEDRGDQHLGFQEEQLRPVDGGTVGRP
jgi:hypothetical protein